jgi:outer membrane protein assembly factor BamC
MPTRRNPASSASCSAAPPARRSPDQVPHHVKGQGESTTVSVLNEAGAPEGSANAQRIVQVIADDLK